MKIFKLHQSPPITTSFLIDFWLYQSSTCFPPLFFLCYFTSFVIDFSYSKQKLLFPWSLLQVGSAVSILICIYRFFFRNSLILFLFCLFFRFSIFFFFLFSFFFFLFYPFPLFPLPPPKSQNFPRSFSILPSSIATLLPGIAMSGCHI